LTEIERKRVMADKFILIVDDEPETLKILSSRLSQEGYDIKCAVTGKEAADFFIEHYYNRPFDAILLDVGLPDISGCDVLKTIRQEEEIRGLRV